MFDKIIYFSIYNKAVIGLLVVLLIIWGMLSFKNLPIDAVPDITNNQVQIITASPNLATQEVERLITYPIELAMASIPRKVEIRSLSRFGLSVVTVVFEDDADTYWARAQVNERLLHVAEQIPAGLGKPEIAPPATGLGEIYQYVLTVNEDTSISLSQLRALQDWVVRRQLLGIAGVADISSFGGKLLQYEIAIDLHKLNAHNLTALDVLDAVVANNSNGGGSYIEKYNQALFIRTEGLVQDMADLALINIKNPNGDAPIKLKNIAKIGYGNAVRYGALTHNTQGEAVGGIVLMLKGANSAAVASLVNQKIEQINQSLPKGVQVRPFLNRQTLVERTIKTVKNNLIEGALIVVFVLTLFLGNWRAGLIVASVIPLAMLFAVGCMQLFGVSGNLMSLGAIDFGLVVDGAVIIVEAILFRFHAQLPNKAQIDKQKEVFTAAAGIRKAASFGEIIILIVYLPILTLVGIEGKMFKPMAQTVSFAIFGAFLLSLTYVPMMAAWLLKPEAKSWNFSDKFLLYLQKSYLINLERFFKLKKMWLSLVFILFVVSIWRFWYLGAEFMPQLDEGDFGVEMRAFTGTSLSDMIKHSVSAADVLKKNFPNEVRDVVGKIGAAEIPTDPMPIEACDLMILLHEKDKWKVCKTREALADSMQIILKTALPGITFGFQQPVQLRFNELMAGARQDIVIKLFGEDLAELSHYGNKIAKIAHRIQGATDVYEEQLTGLPQLIIKFDRHKLAQYGVSILEANQVIATAMGGAVGGNLYVGDRRFDLVVRADSAQRLDPHIWEMLKVRSQSKLLIPISKIANIETIEGPNQIQRDDTKRRMIIGFNVRNRDIASVVKDLQIGLNDKISLPVGYHYSIGGEYQNLQQAQARLLFAVPMALLLIFSLLYFSFKSISDSFLIFTAIPLAAIGGIWALSLRGMPFSISAGIGFIALFGVAVLNGIVLLAAINERLKNQIFSKEMLKNVLFEAAKSRLRPVLLTASVASLGFLPMATATSAGAEVQKPLATVVIGGLISATFLTLFLLPALYTIIHKISKPKNLLTILVLVMGLNNTSWAQKIYTKKMFEQAIEANEPFLKAQTKQMLAGQKTKEAWLNLEPTQISFEGGRYNSFYNDQRFDLNQQFALPSYYLKQKDLLAAQFNSLLEQIDFDKKQMYFLLNTYYINLYYLQADGALLNQLDSLTAQLEKVAQVRYQQGEENKLALIAAQTFAYQIVTWKEQNKAAAKQMASLLQTIEPKEDFLNNILQMPIVETKPIEKIQASAWERIALAKYQENVANTAFLKSQRLPRLGIGYFNQSIIGNQTVNGQEKFFNRNNRFDGITANIQIAIGGTGLKKRIHAQQMAQEASKWQYEHVKIQTQRQWLNLQSAIEAAQIAVSFAENKSLTHANALINQANAALKAGEINFMQFITALEKAFQLKRDYEQRKHQLLLLATEAQYLYGINLFNE